MSKPLLPIFPEPQIERFSAKRMLRLVLDTLNLERGIFFTIWELIKAPGNAMHTYLFVDRKKYFDPVKFLLLTVAIYIFIIINFVPDSDFQAGLEAGMGGEDADEKTIAFGNQVVSFFKRFINPIMLTSIPLAAVASRMVFRRFGLWFTEHLVLNAYLYSMLGVFSILLTLLLVEFPNLVSILIMCLSWVYSIHFFRSVFQLSWGRAIWKSSLALLLGTIFFVIFLSLGIFILVVI